MASENGIESLPVSLGRVHQDSLFGGTATHVNECTMAISCRSPKCCDVNHARRIRLVQCPMVLLICERAHGFGGLSQDGEGLQKGFSDQWAGRNLLVSVQDENLRRTLKDLGTTVSQAVNDLAV